MRAPSRKAISVTTGLLLLTTEDLFAEPVHGISFAMVNL